jgi:hypothetical protein
MAHIYNLIEPGFEKIGLPGLTTLFRPHGITPAAHSRRRESRQVEAINLQENPSTSR